MIQEATRRMFGARINVLAKGHSGIRPETLTQIVDAFNHDCIPLVPEVFLSFFLELSFYY